MTRALAPTPGCQIPTPLTTSASSLAVSPYGYIVKPFRARELKVAVELAHHRVKNNMQVISSLLSIQSAQLKD
ncbi:MAG: histidine kinase dimerization/phosphoacceptor domain -containing protein, partial [Chthoniobacterales bacterium]